MTNTNKESARVSMKIAINTVIESHLYKGYELEDALDIVREVVDDYENKIKEQLER